MSEKFVYWFLDEHNKTHHEGFDVAEEAWNHQQKKINKVLKLIKGWEDQTYKDDLEQLLGEIEDILKGYGDE